jgi:Flp pilus assembly protein TadG
MRATRATERRKRRAREGNVAMLTALSLATLMMFVALSFDVGNMHRVRSEVQSAMDSAALAGAAALDGTAAGIAAARTQAVAYANAHGAYAGPIVANTSNVVVGQWDLNSRTFAAWNGATSVASQNAVRVSYNVAAVTTPFAAVKGQTSAQVGAKATAIGGGPGTLGCGFPLVVPSACLRNINGSNNCGYCMQFANNNSDTAAWTGFGGNGVPAIAAAAAAACASVDADNNCVGAGGCTNAAEAGVTSVKLNNGNILSSQPLCTTLKSLLRRGGPPGTQPQMFTAEVPVVDSGSASDVSCTGSQLSGQKPVVGVTKLDIYGVSCKGGLVLAPGAPRTNCGTVPAGDYIIGFLHCNDTDVSQLGATGFWGVAGRRRLVE